MDSGLRTSLGPGMTREWMMAFGYRYKMERQRNGWWLVCFPGIPEALTEGETESEARRNAVDCVIAALEGYVKAGRSLPRQGARHSARRAD
jgi:predicted RNase H-like HicB family nuclease